MVPKVGDRMTAETTIQVGQRWRRGSDEVLYEVTEVTGDEFTFRTALMSGELDLTYPNLTLTELMKNNSAFTCTREAPLQTFFSKLIRHEVLSGVRGTAKHWVIEQVVEKVRTDATTGLFVRLRHDENTSMSLSVDLSDEVMSAARDNRERLHAALNAIERQVSLELEKGAIRQRQRTSRFKFGGGKL